ncbi:RNase P modulator RnpM [Oceanobacillus sp. CAU 1775]
MAINRKVPERKCVITGEMKPKKELIRIVRNKEGEVFVDATGKKNGRGAYLTRSIEVVDQAEETQILNKQLNTIIDASIYEELRAQVGQKNEK